LSTAALQAKSLFFMVCPRVVESQVRAMVARKFKVDDHYARFFPRGRWREGAVLLALIILVSLAVLVAADAWMIIKDGAQRCGTQFPKWLGCVVANHESLSGSLIGAGGALFAAWVAWHAVMDQIASNKEAVMEQIASDKQVARDTVRPLAYIGVGDYENWVFVKVVNNGTGPMIIKSITVNGKPEPLYKALPDPSTWGVYWRHFVEETADRSVRAGGELVLVELLKNKKVSEEQFAIARDAIRSALAGITVRVEYTNIYNENQPLAVRELKWFRREDIPAKPDPSASQTYSVG
jgi:hypothetical protein